MDLSGESFGQSSQCNHLWYLSALFFCVLYSYHYTVCTELGCLNHIIIIIIIIIIFPVDVSYVTS